MVVKTFLAPVIHIGEATEATGYVITRALVRRAKTCAIRTFVANADFSCSTDVGSNTRDTNRSSQTLNTYDSHLKYMENEDYCSG